MSKKSLDYLLENLTLDARQYEEAINRRLDYFYSLLELFEKTRSLLDSLYIKNYEFCSLGETSMYINSVKEETIDDYPREMRAYYGDIILTFAKQESKVCEVNVNKKKLHNFSNDANKLITVLLLNAEDAIEMGLNRLKSGREW